VIRLTRALADADGAERFAIELLADLARVVRAEDETADVVELHVVTDRIDTGNLTALARGGWSIDDADGVVRIPRAVLRCIAEVAGAVSEQRTTVRDVLGRVPASENTLAAGSAERDPLISRAAMALRAATIRAAGPRPVRLVEPWPDGRRWAAAVTHDLDMVTMWPAFTALRLAELAGKGELRRASRVATAALAAIGRRPVETATESLLRVERERGVRGTWFVLCGTPTLATWRAGDLTYSPEGPATRRILGAVADGGHELALHGSQETVERDTAFAEQRRRLAAIVGTEPIGVRQHFLRLRPGATQRAMVAAGFSYDSTAGFADRNGFRLGVPDVVPAYDASTGRATSLDEAPFCWMDRSLSKYHDVEDPAAWVRDALDLAATCREVEGLWVGIWHPNVAAASLGYPGAADAFEALVRGLLAGGPYVATLGEVVRWRAARRGVRASRVRADGTVELRAATSFGVRVQLTERLRETRESVAA